MTPELDPLLRVVEESELDERRRLLDERELEVARRESEAQARLDAKEDRTLAQKRTRAQIEQLEEALRQQGHAAAELSEMVSERDGIIRKLAAELAAAKTAGLAALEQQRQAERQRAGSVSLFETARAAVKAKAETNSKLQIALDGREREIRVLFEEREQLSTQTRQVQLLAKR